MRTSFLLCACLGVLATAVACGDDSGSGGSGAGSSSGGGGETGDGGSGGTPVVGGAPEGGSGGEGGSGPTTPCQAACDFYDELEVEAQCGYDGSSCLTDCADAFEELDPDCEDEAIAYNECVIAQPAEDFNCTDGTFTLTGGACDEAYNAYAMCVST